jgi:hypothetical protein
MKKIIYVLFAVCIVLGSCSTGDAAGAAAKLFGGSSEALLFLNCRVVSEDEIKFEFSRPVTIKSLNFEPVIEVASIENGSTVKVRLKEIQQPGKKIIADILVEDQDKNTINVLIPFCARNNRMPDLVINEICTETASAAAGKKEEFIEFKMKSAGNLGAMRIVINGNTTAAKETIYEFSPVEVKKDEYMVLHLRTYNLESKDERTDDLNESAGVNASPTARDFWIPGDTKWIQKAATAIYVLDQDDRVIDAVMISENPDNWWAKDYLAEAAEFLFKQGAWKSSGGSVCSPQDAVSSAGTTNTRTICRDETVEDTNTAKDWYITVTSGATPGKPNNINRYQK